MINPSGVVIHTHIGFAQIGVPPKPVVSLLTAIINLEGWSVPPWSHAAEDGTELIVYCTSQVRNPA